jgi:hypothetical protein
MDFLIQSRYSLKIKQGNPFANNSGDKIRKLA